MKINRRNSSFERVLLNSLCAMACASAAIAANQTWLDANANNNWNSTDANWTGPLAWTDGNNAIFGGTGESVTVTAPTSVGTITFNSAAYAIGGSALTLGTGTINTGAHHATIASSLSGATVTKIGTGTLTLSGGGSFSTNIDIQNGAVVLDGGSYNSSNVSGGWGLWVRGNSTASLTVKNNANVVVDSGFQVQMGTANVQGGSLTVDKSGVNSLFYLGNSGSPATLNITGGTMVARAMLLVSNVGSGTLNLEGGTLAWQQSPRIGTGSGARILNMGGGTLRADGNLTVPSTLPFTLTGTGGNFTVDTHAQDVVFSNTLSGSGGLIKTGSGMLTLDSANTFSGPTVVSEGTLKMASASVLSPNLKIMPIGDSITVGYGGGITGYRGPLYTLLNPSASGFQFIGDSMVNPSTTVLMPSSPVDQRYHSGHGYYRIDDVTTNLDGLNLARYNLHPDLDGNTNPNGGYWLTGGHETGRVALFPDAILLMIGTNDVGSGLIAGAQARFETLLTTLTTLRPDARVFVARITPFPSRAADVTTYNTMVTAVAADFQAAGKKITLVDMNTGYPSGSLTDGIHPSTTGYEWMAKRWYEALAATYGNQLPSSALSGTSSVTVAAGARLEGSGLLGGTFSVAGTVAPGGSGIGTLSAGNTTLGGTFECDLAATTSDHITVTGNVLLDGSKLTFNPLVAPSASSYTIMTYTGTRSGTFDAGDSVPAAYVVRYEDAEKKIKLMSPTHLVPGSSDIRRLRVQVVLQKMRMAMASRMESNTDWGPIQLSVTPRFSKSRQAKRV